MRPGKQLVLFRYILHKEDVKTLEAKVQRDLERDKKDVEVSISGYI